MRQHRKSASIIVIILMLILGGLYAWHQVRSHLAAKASAAVGNKPIVVETASVKSQVWHPQIDAIGSFVAQQGIYVTTQVAGVVQSIDFKSGDFVDKGTKLIQLNASVLAATAAQSKAKHDIAVSTYKRDEALYQRHAIALQTLESDKAAMDEAKGAMDEDAANLQQTTISAPFTGRLGIRQINIGQYVQPADNIVSLQSVDPMLVDFSLPEVYLRKIQVGNQVLVTTSAYPGQTFSGKITALNSTLSSDTRTLGIRAEVPNKNKLLVPGMYANVKVVIPMKSNVLTVPQMSIQYSPFGDTVFVVQNHKAVQRYISLGEQRGAEIAITRGISDGETIVSVGGNKLQNGSAVITKDELAAQKQAAVEQKISGNNPASADSKSTDAKSDTAAQGKA
jgi:membrane fusion protein (multidrug efflux system)